MDQGEFEFIDRALREWPDVPEPNPALSDLTHRLVDAARQAARNAADVGPADLAVLLRHALRADAEATGHESGIAVPAEAPWPTGSGWHEFGMQATTDSGLQRVFARPWIPGWLAATDDPGGPAFRGSHREPLGDIPRPDADPFLKSATGMERYRSRGQQEAIRAVIAAPPTATVIGNLPTGTGKSLVGYMPALLGDAPGTTVFVVPTTALALDQERAFIALAERRSDRGRFPRELAYHGELPEGTRQVIRERIAQGSQSIVFTSPESLIQSLSSSVYAAAERRLLRAFVIDEAHIVSQWGAEFRPAFQALAGTRSDLLRVAQAAEAPFRTILLSATLTEESVLAVHGLFGRPGPTELISSVALRDEPSYWLTPCDDEPTQVARALEAVRHLPRPLVLYTTRVDAAKAWIERLRFHGFRRLMLVAGETSASDRRTAIHRLRNRSLDLVVGTSAFGLGVDQPDLRAVVHACLPETVDRYYQEVGRGGRDGNPSTAILLATPRDRAVASNLARRRLIGLERGFERWEWMHLHAEARDDGTLRLPLAVSPPDLPGDSAQNRAWNVRTLLLMDRGGLIALEAAAPPRRDPEESEEDWGARAPAAFDDYSSHAVVRVLAGGLADREVWEEAVSAARDEAIGADRLARRRMDEAIEPNTQLCSLFVSTYTLSRPLPGIPARQFPVPVAPSCGGCPGCRALGLKPRRYVPAAPFPAATVSKNWSTTLQPWFAGQSALAVLYNEDATDTGKRLVRGLQRLARHGMWCLMASEDFLRQSEVAELHRLAPGRAIFHLDRWDHLHAPLLPTALVYGHRQVPADVLDAGGPHRIVFVPENGRDPRHATALIRDYHPAVTHLDDVLERL